MLVILSRIQFALTVAYHFIFVPLTIGLILLIAIFETLHAKRKDDGYRQLADFFGNLFIVNYAIGIVTGIAMSLQFGTNWGGYSSFMGDVFGPPLALEALIAFFLESTFTGIYIFKRAKISPRFRVIAAWLITLGTSISSLWIITASGFMQHPVGYEMASDGSKVILTNIFTVLTNPYTWFMLLHTVASAMLLGSLFVLAICSFKLIKPKLGYERELFKKAAKIAGWVALITSIIVPIIGHRYMGYVIQVQPTKFEAIEGGVPLVTAAFYIMVIIGMIIILLSLIKVIFHKRYTKSRFLLRIFQWTFIGAYVAIMAGWVVTEVGRQPWIVYNLLKTEDAISNVPVASVAFSLVTILLLYVISFVIFIYLMRVQTKKSMATISYDYHKKEEH
ncbi:MAG: cytochrome ubiquinol oxidase subunit I [Bacilli bacterium]|jgi:cytochrome d ubiquinol oxidase subunit I|nr:cytochrome ubiquinol oxidase subunit I [Bacilli bacterium]